MLRTNLSTRPFYNERIVHLLLALAASVVAVLTIFNAVQIVSLSRQNTEFSRLINQDRSEADRLTAEAGRIRAGINQDALKATAEAAAEANSLIDQRTFSWTEFFNRIEDTLPADVMLTAVQPSFDRDRSIVQMTVLGRQTEDVNEFIQKLEATGAFHEVLPISMEETDEGLHQVLLRGEYRRATSEKPPPAPSGSAAAPGSTPPAGETAGQRGQPR